MPDSCDPMDCSLSGSSVHAISQAVYWTGLLLPSPGDPPHLGIKPALLLSYQGSTLDLITSH